MGRVVIMCYECPMVSLKEIAHLSEKTLFGHGANVEEPEQFGG